MDHSFEFAWLMRCVVSDTGFFDGTQVERSELCHESRLKESREEATRIYSSGVVSIYT
jgi:hypothetical protein